MPPERALRWSIWLGPLLAAAVLIALAIGYPRFREYNKGRLTRSAAAMLGTEDFRGAYLLLEQLVQDDPRNFEARRLFAQVLQTVEGNRATLEWAALAKSEPDNSVNFIGYAKAALRARQPEQAAEALTGLRRLQPASKEYHQLAAAVALAGGDGSALRRSFEALVQAEPQNEVTRFGLASLLLQSSDPAEVSAARSTLEAFAHGGRLQVRATLALLRDAGRRWPEIKSAPLRGNRLARQLQWSTQRSYAAPFIQREADLNDLIARMMNQPEWVPEDAARLAQWLMESGREREAMVWLTTLAQGIRRAPEVREVEAECAARIADWPRLESLVVDGAWGPVTAVGVHLAFQARAKRQQQNDPAALSLWASAIKAVDQSWVDLHVLARLARAWDWPANMESRVLQVLQNRFPADRAVWRRLADLALANRDAAMAWKVYEGWIKADPKNAQVRVERALLGLLTRPQEAGLMAEAEQLFRQNPDSRGNRLMRALQLWRQGEAAEAHAVLRASDFDYKAEPRAQLALGLVLTALGRQTDGEETLRKIPVERLMPEERALIAAALARP